MPRQGMIAIMIAIMTIATAAVLYAQDRQPGRRVALVIGNSAYAHTAPLETARNDAEDLAPILAAMGFEVIARADLGREQLDQAIKAFAATLKGAEIGLFFYAGHSVQLDGVNYIVPIDARLSTVGALVSETVRLDAIVSVMGRGAATNVLFLDACRDNPLVLNLARSPDARGSRIGRGLAPVPADFGTLISYAAQPETLAADSDRGRNSPYTSALKAFLGLDGEELTSNLAKIRQAVISATGRRQTPWWDETALTAPIYLGASVQATGSTLRGDPGVSSAPTQKGDTAPVPKPSGKCKVDPTDWGSCE